MSSHLGRSSQAAPANLLRSPRRFRQGRQRCSIRRRRRHGAGRRRRLLHVGRFRRRHRLISRRDRRRHQRTLGLPRRSRRRRDRWLGRRARGLGVDNAVAIGGTAAEADHEVLARTRCHQRTHQFVRRHDVGSLPVLGDRVKNSLLLNLPRSGFSHRRRNSQQRGASARYSGHRKNNASATHDKTSRNKIETNMRSAGKRFVRNGFGR